MWPISAASEWMWTTRAPSGTSGPTGTSNSVKQWHPAKTITSLSRTVARLASYRPAKFGWDVGKPGRS